MDTYYVTRSCFTGINEYRHYHNGREIGNADALVLPNFPISMHCGNLCLRYTGDPDITLVPGISRSIPEEASGREYARIFWDGMGLHRLHTPFGSFRIEYQGGTYRFCAEDLCIAELGAPDAREQAHYLCRGNDPELRMVMRSLRPLPAELAILMLSFPLLQLGP